MFDKFGAVIVVVSDMARSVAFYRDVLGLTLLFETPHFSQFDVGGVGLGLHPEGRQLKVNPQTGIAFGFYTVDLEKTIADLVDRGAQIIQKQEEFGGTLAIVADPDGYAIQILQLRGGEHG
jgi:lactoylglutathione lyase